MIAFDTDITNYVKRYSKIREFSEKICAPLKAEDHVVQPIVDVSPPKWHLGHTTWFFETFILQPNLQDYKVFDKDFNYVFNSYYEGIGKRVVRTDRGNLSRPGVEKILEYRKYVDRHIQQWLENEPEIKELELFELGLQHEQQHQELLFTDIKYILGNNPLLPAYLETEVESQETKTRAKWLPFSEGMYEIGYDGDDFHFDNEREKHNVFLHDFSLRSLPVTNAEYFEFIKDGGYENFKFWHMEGWAWVNQNDVKAPQYWLAYDGGWKYYTLHGVKEIDWNAPVTHISFYEASAFASWAGYRLPTEFEWEAACKQSDGLFAKDEANLGHNWNLKPIAGSDHFFGNVWNWTESAYLPYPGFEPAAGAVGEYNGKFMVNQMVLRGGSCVTPENHVRATYRNFFHPDLRWQFTGIRLAKKHSF